jgi:hypothetical protein
MIKLSRCLVQIFGILFLMVCFCLSFCYAAEEGKLYVVGMGPSGADLTAPRGLVVLEKAWPFFPGGYL